MTILRAGENIQKIFYKKSSHSIIISIKTYSHRQSVLPRLIILEYDIRNDTLVTIDSGHQEINQYSHIFYRENDNEIVLFFRLWSENLEIKKRGLGSDRGTSEWRDITANDGKFKPYRERSNNTMTIWNQNYLISFGGYDWDSSEVSTELLVFSFISNEWNELEPIGECIIGGRYSHSSCIHEDTLYVSGGWSHISRGQLEDLWMINLRRLVWSKIKFIGGIVLPKMYFHFMDVVHLNNKSELVLINARGYDMGCDDKTYMYSIALPEKKNGISKFRKLLFRSNFSDIDVFVDGGLKRKRQYLSFVKVKK